MDESGLPTEPMVPRYGEASLADVVPSVMAGLDVPGFANRLGMESVAGICLLVVDGLGWELLRGNREHAPFLAAASDGGRAITAGFPSTTSASLASLGTGLTPGEHGMVGYTFAVPGFDRPLNSLQWELYGHGPNIDLLTALVPEEFQPAPTVMERAGEVGHVVTLIGPSNHARSGLTRAILRGGRYLGADTLEDLVRSVATALTAGLTAGPKVSVYAYHPFLDMFGHVNGAGSSEWMEHLARVDGATRAIAERLPHGCVLAVTADHGMVNIDPAHRMDVADIPGLRSGVRMMAGEARARHVHARPGAEPDVLAIWSEVLGAGWWVRAKDQAIEAGWFGPHVNDRVRPRIGDVVAAARSATGVFQREVDPLQASLVGHHGSLTAAEQLVPWIVIASEAAS